MCMPPVENEVMGKVWWHMPIMWNHCLDQLAKFPLKKKFLSLGLSRTWQRHQHTVAVYSSVCLASLIYSQHYLWLQRRHRQFLKIVLFPFWSQIWKLIALGGIDSGTSLTHPLPPPLEPWTCSVNLASQGLWGCGACHFVSNSCGHWRAGPPPRNTTPVLLIAGPPELQNCVLDGVGAPLVLLGCVWGGLVSKDDWSPLLQ